MLNKVNDAAYTFDFGSFDISTGTKNAVLALSNAQLDPVFQDLLNGSFDISAKGAFSLSRFDSFTGLAISGSRALTISFDSNLTMGSYTGQLVFTPISANASGTSSMNAITMNLEALAIPEPSTWAIFLGSLGMLTFGQRLRRRSKA